MGGEVKIVCHDARAGAGCWVSWGFLITHQDGSRIFRMGFRDYDAAELAAEEAARAGA